MARTVRSRHDTRLTGLKTERQNYEATWSEYDEYIAPGRLRLVGQDSRGKKRMGKIVDETAIEAKRTFQSGMHSGLTSPARPWVKLKTLDDDLTEFGPVKDYLFACQKELLQVLRRSNIYNSLHSGYGDLGQFGGSCMLLVGDGKDLRSIPLMTGQYWIAQNAKGRVDTLYRQIKMTVEQMVGRFVARSNGDMDWSRVSNTVKTLWDKSNYDEWVDVFHAIEPRRNRDHGNPSAKHMPFASNYWEDGQNNDVMLEESGFKQNRILAPRYETAGEDVYGSGHPGEVSLAATKMLQMEQKNKGQAIDRMVRPPLQGPSELKKQNVSTLPGKITYYDDPTGKLGLRPVHEVNISLSELAQDISEVQQRINRLWYADLFFAITQMEGVQPRNIMELTQRKEEQLLQLGPMIERQINEQADPLIEIAFAACEEGGLFPEPPQELVEREEPLEIENISILAQAQRAVSTGSIERLVGFVGQVAAAKPDALDKLDVDQAVDEYADAIGTAATIIRSNDEVKQIREQREQQMQAQEQSAMAAQVAPAVKDGADAMRLMSEAQKNSTGDDLIAQILGA